ncbi:MAG: hypothetical protein Q4E12_04320 [Coriobacteriia bacterium]|nr:hypothetical protein [Coriobacteriia bacterium]
MDSRMQHAFEQRHGKHTPADPALRGKLFKPFAALKGYYDIIDRRSRVVCPQAPLTDEEERALNQQLACVSKGSLVSVTYYEEDGYVTEVAAVRQLDTTFRVLHLVSHDVPLDSVRELHLVTECA